MVGCCFAYFCLKNNKRYKCFIYIHICMLNMWKPHNYTVKFQIFTVHRVNFSKCNILITLLVKAVISINCMLLAGNSLFYSFRNIFDLTQFSIKMEAKLVFYTQTSSSNFSILPSLFPVTILTYKIMILAFDDIPRPFYDS